MPPPHCSTVTCSKCVDGWGASSRCTDCDLGHFGKGCEKACECAHGSNSSGIKGNGTCARCVSGYVRNGTTCAKKGRGPPPTPPPGPGPSPGPAPGPTPAPAPSDFWHDVPLPALIGTITAAIAIVVALVAIIARARARARRYKRLYKDMGEDQGQRASSFGGIEYAHWPALHPDTYFPLGMAVDRSRVMVLRLLGSGNFGTVHAGTLAPLEGGAAGNTAVAVKVPAPIAQVAFDHELRMLSAIVRLGGHPHIVAVIGCVPGGNMGGPPLLLLELYGDANLKQLLVASMGDEQGELPVQTLLRFGTEVASALAFLEAHSMLHRDIAARNVLLTDTLSCKLADFGLARGIMDRDYYRLKTTSAPVPMRCVQKF